MDRDIATEVRRRRIVRRTAAVVIATTAIGFSFAATVQWLRPSIRRTDIQTARVERGAVDATVQASGIVMPEVEQAVSSPVEARVLGVRRRAGDRVRVGDELLSLDTSATRLDVARLDERIAQKENEGAQLRLRIEENLAGLRAQLEQERLDAKIVHLKNDQTRRLRNEGLVAESEALLASTTAQKSDISLRQLDENLARARRTAEAQLAAAALDVSLLRRERDESRRLLDLAMMRAARDGVVTSIVQDEGTTVRRGDVLARIADLSSFRVVATVSDLYVPRLAPGMRARVKVDDATSVFGSVAAIDPRIENGVARIHISLDPGAHARLRNNLRVDVFIVTGRRSGVLTVRRGGLGEGQRDDVFLVRGSRLVRTPVRFGLLGDENVEIAAGAAEGEEIVISNMSDYEGIKEIRLK